jgi:4'-phosphopantetheinyl transferase
MQQFANNLFPVTPDLVWDIESIPKLATSSDEELDFIAFDNLVAEEWEFYKTITFKKRRIEWLGGRITAKRSISSYCKKKSGITLAPSEIKINTIKEGIHKGKPYVRQNCHISISHSVDFALCAVSSNGVGIDIEKVRVMPAVLIHTAFDDVERERIEDRKRPLANGFTIDETIVLCWSFKEAFLKYLGIGLRANLKNIIIDDWSPHNGFQWRLKDELKDCYGYTKLIPLHSWGQIIDGYALAAVWL